MTPSQRNPPEDRLVAALLAPDIVAMLEESPADIATETEEIHPADLADVAELLERQQLSGFLSALGPARAADVLEYLDEELRTEYLEAITPREAAELVSEMTPDDRADALEEIDEEHADDILAEIPQAERQEIEKLLSYDPASAGGLMTTDFVSVSGEMTVEAALENVRAVARSGKTEAMHNIYTTDAQGRVAGVMSLRELLAAPAGAKISEIAWTEVVSVKPDAPQEEVARVISNYDLVVVPVVSESGHVMGVITVDDVIDAIQEEQTEDVQKFGGMEALDEPYMQIGLLSMIKKRAGWLSILLVSEMLTTSVMQHFDKELQAVAALALFVPLVVSSGGNSGSQATSLITRAMALRENVSLAVLEKLLHGPFIDRAAEARLAENSVRKFNIRASGIGHSPCLHRAWRFAGGGRPDRAQDRLASADRGSLGRRPAGGPASGVARCAVGDRRPGSGAARR